MTHSVFPLLGFGFGFGFVLRVSSLDHLAQGDLAALQGDLELDRLAAPTGVREGDLDLVFAAA
jgi:hypothetical protein